MDIVNPINCMQRVNTSKIILDVKKTGNKMDI